MVCLPTHIALAAGRTNLSQPFDSSNLQRPNPPAGSQFGAWWFGGFKGWFPVYPLQTPSSNSKPIQTTNAYLIPGDWRDLSPLDRTGHFAERTHKRPVQLVPMGFSERLPTNCWMSSASHVLRTRPNLTCVSTSAFPATCRRDSRRSPGSCGEH